MSQYIMKKVYCANCGKIGHEFRKCTEPITSLGIINFKIEVNTNEMNTISAIKREFHSNQGKVTKIISEKYPQLHCFYNENFRIFPENNIKIFDDPNDQTVNQIICSNEDDHKKFCYYKEKIKFLMVSRRFSLGYVEFIRGKYLISDVDGIIKLFKQMTEDEIKNISKYNYDKLLYQFLNRNDEDMITVLSKVYDDKKYSTEYYDAKLKFNALCDAEWEQDILPLKFYINNIKPEWKQAEWGFPKGRRNKKDEDNLLCACREFEEETGYNSDEYVVLNRIEPIEEKLIGTNGINYKHIYYLALNNTSCEKMLEDLDYFEIGEVQWFTYDEARRNIRPYHMEKKQILTHIFMFIMNFIMHYDENNTQILS